MTRSRRLSFLGRSRPPGMALVGVVVTAWLATLVGYAVGLFETTGGIVWIPVDAAVVGLLAGGVLGYARAAIWLAWVGAYASFLGWWTHRALAQSGGPLADRLGFLLRIDGLAFLAVEALLVGTVAYAVGQLLRIGRDAFGPSPG